jgi:hypothetical protein
MKQLHILATSALLASVAGAQITQITMSPYGIEANLDILCAQAGNPEYIGNNPAAVAWDGVNAWVAGYNNSGVAANIGISYVQAASSAPAFSPAFGQINCPPQRGYSGLDVRNGTVLGACDTGASDPRGIVAYTSTGTQLWQAAARGSSGVAFDPDFNAALGGGSGAGWMTFSSGRRSLNDFLTGATLFDTNSGMVIDPGLGTLWRDTDFDLSTGDVYLRVSNTVVKATRNGANSVAGALQIAAGTSAPFVAGQNIAFVDAPFGDFVIWNDRSGTALGQQYSTVIRATDLAGNAITLDWGSFAPLTGTGWYDFSYDTASNTLCISDFTNRRLYFFQPTVTVSGTPFCFGDGTGTACPCGNAGLAGNGCASSVNANGGNLAVSGLASLAADGIVLSGSGLPNSSALYFQGTLRQSGGAGALFGDGLRCAGGTVVRLGTKANVAGASQYPAAGDLTVSQKGLVTLPGTRTYQIWYRNAAAFCTASTFNLTNGFEINWLP